jgi:cell division control protein 24
LIKHTSATEVEEKQLSQGLEAIERITSQINEAIRKSENVEVVKDLEGRVEDWKGHRLEHFGELLLHGQFSVIKSDTRGEVEREVNLFQTFSRQPDCLHGQYYIYLFERILLCCKEMGIGKKQNKTMSMGKNSKAVGKKRSSLQLKGRIFMQNVTEVVSLARVGNQPMLVCIVLGNLLAHSIATRFLYFANILER